MHTERVITIEEEDDGATYVRRIGGERDGRVLETKSVDLAALVPDEGGLHALPSKCCFAETYEGLSVFVMQDEPQTRTIRWITEHEKYMPMKERLLLCGAHHAQHEDVATFEARLCTQQIFSLAFPYIIKVYLFAGDVLQSVSLWYRTKPITSESDGLLEPNLPNRYTVSCPEPYRYGELCLSSIAKQTRGGAFAEMISFVEVDFWGSAWTQDLTEDFFMDAERIAEVASPWEWERASRADSQFPLHAPWRSADRTIGDVIRTLLHKTDADPQIFTLLANRIQRADPMDVRRADTREGVRASTANSVEVTDVMGGRAVLRAGDVLVCAHTVFPELVVGSRSVIEWFGRDEGEGSRLVKLAGVDAPLPLVVKGTLLVGFVREGQTIEEVIEVHGVRIEPGTIVEITNHDEWPDRKSRYYIVASLRRGGEGELLAKFEGEGFYTVLGKGDTLFSGLRLLSREVRDTEGYLAARVYHLGDGTEVKVDDRFFITSGTGIKEIEVHRFFPLRSGDLVRHFRTTSGVTIPLENGKGALSLVLVPTPKNPIRVARWWDKALRHGDTVFYGGMGPFRIERFSPLFEDGSRWMRFHDGQWVRFIMPGGVPIDKVVPMPRIMIDAEGGLRFGEKYYPVGARFNVAGTRQCFTATRYLMPEIGVVGAMDASGQMIMLTSRGEWLKDKISVQFRARWRRHLPLVRGMRLRLTVDVPNAKKGAGFIISHFVTSADGTYVTLVTANGLCFDLMSQNAAFFEVRVHNVWISLVGSHETSVRFPARTEFVGESGLRVLWTRGAHIVPRERMVKFGTLVGSDHRGNSICVGHRVKVIGELDSRTSTPTSEALARAGHVFTVVHACRCGSLYLDAGQEVYDGGSTDRFTCCRDVIPPHLRRDPTWWARLAWASASKCKRVDHS